MFNILDNPVVWNFSRKAINNLFGSYKIRVKEIRKFDIDDNGSIIDIGCGIGQYSTMTNGKYLGIDFNKNYIQTAKRLYGSKSKQFSSKDINDVALKKSVYDTALLIDITHHLSNRENEKLMQKLNSIAPKHIVICDPITQSAYNFLGRFITYFDRGKHIRSKEELIKIVTNNLIVEKIVLRKIMWIEGIFILARSRKNNSLTEG